MPGRKLGFILVALVFCVFGSPVHGDIVIRDVDASVVEGELHVSTNVELNLSEHAELAVENGVRLVVLTEFSLIRDGVFWNETLYETKSGKTLRYHSLADRYVVENIDGGEIDTYGSVEEALGSMGALRSLVFALPPDMSMDAPEFILAVRTRLDLDNLPAALRPLAFFSPSWQLASDWTLWQINKP